MGYLVEEQIAAILTPVFGNEIYPVVHPDPDGTISAVSPFRKLRSNTR